jgi:hypothetical protein
VAKATTTEVAETTDFVSELSTRGTPVGGTIVVLFTGWGATLVFEPRLVVVLLPIVVVAVTVVVEVAVLDEADAVVDAVELEPTVDEVVLVELPLARWGDLVVPVTRRIVVVEEGAVEEEVADRVEEGVTDRGAVEGEVADRVVVDVVVDRVVVDVVVDRAVVAGAPGPEEKLRTTLTQSIRPVIMCKPFPPVFVITKLPSIGKYWAKKSGILATQGVDLGLTSILSLNSMNGTSWQSKSARMLYMLKFQTKSITFPGLIVTEITVARGAGTSCTPRYTPSRIASVQEAKARTVMIADRMRFLTRIVIDMRKHLNRDYQDNILEKTD